MKIRNIIAGAVISVGLIGGTAGVASAAYQGPSCREANMRINDRERQSCDFAKAWATKYGVSLVPYSSIGVINEAYTWCNDARRLGNLTADKRMDNRLGKAKRQAIAYGSVNGVCK